MPSVSDLVRNYTPPGSVTDIASPVSGHKSSEGNDDDGDKTKQNMTGAEITPIFRRNRKKEKKPWHKDNVNTGDVYKNDNSSLGRQVTFAPSPDRPRQNVNDSNIFSDLDSQTTMSSQGLHNVLKQEFNGNSFKSDEIGKTTPNKEKESSGTNVDNIGTNLPPPTSFGGVRPFRNRVNSGRTNTPSNLSKDFSNEKEFPDFKSDLNSPAQKDDGFFRFSTQWSFPAFNSIETVLNKKDEPIQTVTTSSTNKRNRIGKNNILSQNSTGTSPTSAQKHHSETDTKSSPSTASLTKSYESNSRPTTPLSHTSSEIDSNPQISELHELISSASSPQDSRWIKALRLISSTSDPYSLVSYPIKDAHGWTALHVACLSNPPLYFIHALMIVFPAGCSIKDSGGRLPLHLAGAAGASAAVFECLVKRYKRSVCVKDDVGFVPLHMALRRYLDADESEDNFNDLTVETLRILLGQLYVDDIELNDCEMDIKRRLSGKRSIKKKIEHFDSAIESICNESHTHHHKNRAHDSGDHKDEGNLLSRGFGRSLNAEFEHADSNDGNPFNSPLSSLWDERQNEHKVTSSNLSGFLGRSELIEVKKYNEDVKLCLREILLWKKKQKRKGDERFNSSTLTDKERSIELLNPAAIPAPPHMRLPLHMAIRRKYSSTVTSMLQDKKKKPNTPISTHLIPQAHHNNILRVLVHAHPPSLTHQDSNGYTPLIECLYQLSSKASSLHGRTQSKMLLRDIADDLETVELLIGFQASPISQWHDLHENSYSSFPQVKHASTVTGSKIPASIPTNRHMFPLHIASSESLHYEVMKVIQASYPHAKYARDERGCTPLHSALCNTVIDAFPSPQVMSILLDERVARTRDDYDRTIFDLMAIHAKCFKGTVAPNSEKDMALYRPIFQSSAPSSCHGQFDFYNDNVKIQERDFLSKLFVLPPWLRRQACTNKSVHYLLLSHLARPTSTLFVLLHGFVLCLALISLPTVVNGIKEPYSNLAQVSSIILLSLETCLFLTNAFFDSLKRVLSNIWYWIALLGSCLAIYTSFSGAEETPTIDAITIGFLWAMVIGYFARWFYSVSHFCSLTVMMIQEIIPSLLVFFIFIQASMQVIYLTMDLDSGRCVINDALDDAYVGEGATTQGMICSIWSSPLLLYLLFSGDVMLYNESSMTITTIILTIVFVLISFVLLIRILVSLINVPTSRDRMGCVHETVTITLDFYWIPLLSLVYMSNKISDNFVHCLENFTNKSKSYQDSTDSEYVSKIWTSSSLINSSRVFVIWEKWLGSLWCYLSNSFNSADGINEKWWDLKDKKIPSKGRNVFYHHVKVWFVRIVALIFLPIWAIIGFGSLGLLWPPQIRFWVYTSSPLGYEIIHDKSLLSEDDDSKNEILSLLSLQMDIAKLSSALDENSRNIMAEVYQLKKLFMDKK